MEDLDAASLDDVKASFRSTTRRTTRSWPSPHDVDPKLFTGWVEQYFGAIPANPNLPVALPDMTLLPTHEARSTRRDPDRAAAADPLLPRPGVRRSAPGPRSIS
jgi:hypothetical protein